MRQRLGGLKVDRHIMLLDFSYTPTPKLLVEAEIPVTRISFKDEATSSSGEGIGNVLISGKYRFFRQVEAWGDRQAALRFGLELPTGQKGVRSTAAFADQRRTLSTR
jgi:hypothetical protein